MSFDRVDWQILILLYNNKCPHWRNKGPQTLEICEPFLISEGAEAHARGGGDGREEGRERSYYDLHCDLDDAFLHLSPPFD